MKRKVFVGATLLLALFFVGTGGTAVPGLITYQGLLADSAGNSADGLFLIQFRIYDDSTGGSILWDNGFRTVQVTDGLFTYTLGDSTFFPLDLFDSPVRWLGIRVGVDPELTPRKQLVSSPYSLRAAKADVVSNDSEFVHVSGDEMNGNLNFDIGNDGDIELALYTSLGRGQFSMLDNGDQRIFLGTQSGGGSMIIQDNTDIFAQLSGDNTFGGGLFLQQGDGTNGAELTAGSGISESHLRLYDNAGAPTVALFGNSTGDGAALLPDNSVNSTEILDNSILATDIAADAVGSSEIINASIAGVDIGASTINASHVADNSLSGTEIMDNTLMSADIAAGAILSAEIADGVVTTIDIADNTITAADIADGSIITADIATGGVTTSDIADGGVALIDLSSGIVPAVGSVELGNGTALSAVPTTLDSFIVTSPGTGYLWVTVMGQYYFDMPAPASTTIIEAGAIGLCTSPASDATCGGTYEVIYYQDSEDATPNGLNHTVWFSLQRVIPVIASSYTFYLNGEATSLNGYNLQLWENPKATALFVPATLTISTAPKPPTIGDQTQIR
jgi:hypothetical protein